MSWAYLILAGIFEIVWAVALKYSRGFTRPLPAAIVLTAGFASFYLLALSVRHIPLGTAYAVWTGIGIIGTAILGIILFAEPRTALRLACIALILVGIVGLRVQA